MSCNVHLVVIPMHSAINIELAGTMVTAKLGMTSASVTSCQILVLFPNGEQPEQGVLAHILWQPFSGCIAIFHKYCCFTKHAAIITNVI